MECCLHMDKNIYRQIKMYPVVVPTRTNAKSVPFFSFCLLNVLCGPVLGELQFAFICFLIGNVYDAFEHWKALLNLLCRSEEATVKHQALFSNLISVLYHQLHEIPADFFVDIVSQDNFLTNTLQVRKLVSVVYRMKHVGSCKYCFVLLKIIFFVIPFSL